MHVHYGHRQKDMIIKGGENISPRQIEEALYKHPAVAECAVFGVPCARFQEEIAAAVVLKQGHQASVEEIQEQALQFVTKFKRPQFVSFRDQLPKNSNGKILKRKLREEWVDATKSEGGK
ncbi:MAG: hypothetical protein KF861_00250 [Planctomycetaceae bacterium]|nr:hypothetical protein [Planctomycetaceae bacterium]